MNKILALIVLSVLILTACGQANTPATSAPAVTSAPTEPPVPPTPTPEPKIGGTLTVWCWKAAWADTVVKSGALDAFLAKYPDVTIDYVELTPTDLYQKLPLALQAGTGAPDFACVESSHLAQFVDLGGLADLTNRIQPYVKQMNAYKWADAMKDGKYYAMPWDSGPVVTYYRRDVFEKAGFPSDPDSVSKLVATWDEYLNVCKTIKAKTGSDCFSNNKANNYARLYEMMLWQQGLGYYDAEGTVTVDSPENIATLDEMKKFWDAGVTSDQLEWTDGWYAELASMDKPIATLVEAAWMGVFLKSWIAPGTSGKWGVALMPAMTAGQVRAANDGGSNAVIPDQSKNKDAAWALAAWLFGKADSQMAMFKTSDFLPSLETTYSDPSWGETDPFFDNQAVRQTYINVVKTIPRGYVYGPYYNQMNGFVATALQQVATGKKSSADALKEAADAIRSATGMP
jgi:ABC-type glycerol-3-phosphate transport system substrate-binding protein